MAPDAPTIGTSDVGSVSVCAAAAQTPPEQIKGEVAPVPHRVLDVVAEDPEKEHVPEQVAPARVHEHAGEHGLEAENRIVEEVRRHQGPHAGLEPARPGGGAQGRRRLHDEESDVRAISA